MKNRQEFTKKMNISEESFAAIDNFYGKMKENPRQKEKFINSIKKEINKISRIKDVFKNPSNNCPEEDRERIYSLRDRLDEEDRKIRNYQKKGYFCSDEEEEDNGLVDVEGDDFLMDYWTRFGARLKILKEELATTSGYPKKKRMKPGVNKMIKGLQSNIQNMEEHLYYLEQLLKNKDLVDVDKLENICDDMDFFLLHPGNKAIRDELKDEYHQMLKEIEQDLEDEKIEEQKQTMHDQEVVEVEEVAPPVYTANPDKPKTRKELRQERLRKEEEEKKKGDKGGQTKKKEKKEVKDKTFNIQEVTEGTTIDVMDFMSKWANAIVTKVEKDKIQVIVEGGLEMEIQKSEASEVVARFESKAGKCNPDKLDKLKKSANKDEEEKEVITKKANKGKRHQTNQPATPVEEPEKQENPMIDLEDQLKNPGPIIVPNSRAGKETSKRKKVRKNDSISKPLEPTPKVDNQNFPILGGTTNPDSNKGSILGTSEPTQASSQKSKSRSKKRQKSKDSSTPVQKPASPKPSFNFTVKPQPQKFNEASSVLDMLEQSYDAMKMERKMEDSEPLRPQDARSTRNAEELATMDKTLMKGNKEDTGISVEKFANKFGENTLFFIFYYQQNTYKQLLAADELVRRNWYYVPKFQTWFCEHEKTEKNSPEKQVKNEKLYFDFGPDWAIKRVKINNRQK